MRRTNRNHAVCFKSLEKALAESPETYGCLDLLCAGWPCQDNSTAGKRAGHAGKKSGLWKELRRIIKLLCPKWLVLENVPGLLSVRGGKDFWQVIADLDELSYCVAVKLLDSQNFGLAQRRKRVFIVGSFGNTNASKVFLEQKGSRRNDSSVREIRQRGLCLSTRTGERQDPTAETYVANVIQESDYGKTQHGQFGNEGNLVSQTLGATQRGKVSFVWQDTHIAETDTDGKRKVTGVFSKLDSLRGILIGNAVSVSVSEWIGKRIKELENDC